MLEQKEQLEQKHLHLLQILDAERQAKWHYVQQTEELAEEVKKLKNEVSLGVMYGPDWLRGASKEDSLIPHLIPGLISETERV